MIERQGQNGNTYANVNGVTPVPSVIKQAGLPQPVNKNELFNLQEPDWALFETFSDHLKAKITASPEFTKIKEKPVQAISQAPSVDDDIDSDIPF